MAAFSSAEQVIQWVHAAGNGGIKPGLERMEWLMARLGHPERRLKCIHIAGTNGKGSTAAYLASMLYHSGYDVGLFTSPYLEEFEERIRFNGENISEEDLVQVANMLHPLAEELSQTPLGAPTEFELTTAMAILYYARISYPYWVVWETGLGGRLDSTNIVYPVVSIITTVGMDHTAYLGESLSEIAREKAGIIKPGVPVVTGVTAPEALEVIRAMAAEHKATLYELGKDFHFYPGEVGEGQQSLHFQGPFRDYPDVRISLMGAHQRQNAAVALMAVEVMRQYLALVYEDEELYQGFLEARWPGRLESLSASPRLLLDGAHNPQGAQALAQALAEEKRHGRLFLVFGTLADKRYEEMLKHLLPLAHTVVLTEPDSPRRAAAESLARVVREEKPELPLLVEPDWRQAVEGIWRDAGEQDTVLVCGSLYLVGDVRKHFRSHMLSMEG